MHQENLIEGNTLLAIILAFPGLSSYMTGAAYWEKPALILQEHSWRGCGSCQA